MIARKKANDVNAGERRGRGQRERERKIRVGWTYKRNKLNYYNDGQWQQKLNNCVPKIKNKDENCEHQLPLSHAHCLAAPWLEHKRAHVHGMTSFSLANVVPYHWPDFSIAIQEVFAAYSWASSYSFCCFISGIEVKRNFVVFLHLHRAICLSSSRNVPYLVCTN